MGVGFGFQVKMFGADWSLKHSDIETLEAVLL